MASLAVMEWLGRLEVGEGIGHDHMAVFPVFSQNGGVALQYLTLAEAMAGGTVVVTEKASASVPELVLQNRGKVNVLILDGEEIIGGKQNRIVNASFLVGAGAKVNLPVSCVEQGRWHDVSPQFSSGESTYFSLKREKFLQVRSNLREQGRATADQSAIWSTLSARRAADDVMSETGAMADIFDKHEDKLAAYLGAFPIVLDATGLIVAIGGQVVGADLFDQSRTAAALWPKLVRSYALDAVSARLGGTVGRDEALRLLERTRGAHNEVFPSLTLGHDVRFEGDSVVGAALVYENTPIHVSLFRTDGSQTGTGANIASASRRRQFRQRPTTPEPGE